MKAQCINCGEVIIDNGDMINSEDFKCPLCGELEIVEDDFLIKL